MAEKKKTSTKKKVTKAKEKSSRRRPKTVRKSSKPKMTEAEIAEKAEKIAKKISKEDVAERAKKLAEGISGKTTEEIKEQLKESRKTLVELNDYIKYGVYIGTKVITPHMRPFVYRRRNDGIAIFDINEIDHKLRNFITEFVKYNAEDFILVCKREAGWKAAKKFSELTGVRVFTKKYPAGILTNSQLPNFFETEMVFICDPWLDRNALSDAGRIRKKVFALCDTNNYTFGIKEFAVCNNKSGKSIGLILYILAREYLKSKGDKTKLNMEDFTGQLDEISEDGKYVKEGQAVKEGV